MRQWRPKRSRIIDTIVKWLAFSRPALALAVVVLATGCSMIRRLWAPPADARISVISIVGIPSGDHLLAAATVIETESAVYEAKADLVAAEITVWTRADWPEAELLQRFSAHHLEAIPGRGHGSYFTAAGFPPGSDARILTLTGQSVPNLDSHAVTGKVTIFDFYADWCGPCHQLDETFARVLSARQDVALRKLNIADFRSPLAQDWQVQTIPHVIIYDRARHKIEEISGSNPTKLALALGHATVGQK
jgi:thiol-disulfide isomerase/thioredoxin